MAGLKTDSSNGSGDSGSGSAGVDCGDSGGRSSGGTGAARRRGDSGGLVVAILVTDILYHLNSVK